MEEIIHEPAAQNEAGNLTEYTESVVDCFDSVPEVAKPLIGSAGRLLNRIEKMLYSAPAFVGAVKAVIPEEAYQVILTDERRTETHDEKRWLAYGKSHQPRNDENCFDRFARQGKAVS